MPAIDAAPVAVSPVECGRHGFPWAPSGRRSEPWYVVRCSHCGPRFVVHLRDHETGFNIVDYVEDLASGDVLVEDVDGLGDDDSAKAFDRLVARMLAGEPPQPEE